MPGALLSLREREEINVALIEDRARPWAEIARRIRRHPTTVAREVARNGGRARYRAAMAQRAAERARCRPRPRILARRGPLRERVIAELAQGRSPVAIWANLVAEGAAAPCAETIYSAVYDGVLGIAATECLRSRRPRRRSRHRRCPSQRPSLPTIAARPAAVNDRSEAGHWEADQIIGRANRSSMLWLTERVSRYAIGITMPLGYDAEAMVAGLAEGLDRIPVHLRRSLTFDQGSEWANWETIADTYSLDCWFCEPHSPWQRGQVENLNRQWRWWFPRGTNLAVVTPAEVDRVASIVNGQRRRSLGYRSPAMLYGELTVQ